MLRGSLQQPWGLHARIPPWSFCKGALHQVAKVCDE